MTPCRNRVTPLTRRMAEDMQLRNLSPNTIDAYTWHVDKFCQFFGKQPDGLGREEIRQYQLYLVNEKNASWSSFNQAVCGLRFLYEVTLRRPWTVQHIPFGKKPKKLPTVLGDEEVTRLLACLHNHKHRTVLTVCYAAGLRLSEATHLKAEHIDSQRMQIRVANGKGRKERLVPLSPRLLGELREYWIATRPPNYQLRCKCKACWPNCRSAARRRWAGGPTSVPKQPSSPRAPVRTASASWCVCNRANVPVGETSSRIIRLVLGGIPPPAIANRPVIFAWRSLDMRPGSHFDTCAITPRPPLLLRRNHRPSGSRGPAVVRCPTQRDQLASRSLSPAASAV